MPTSPTLDDATIVERLPGMRLDHDSKWFYAAWLDRRLVANRCGDCGNWSLPLRPRCPKCWSANVGIEELSGRGEVFLATYAHQRRAMAGEVPETAASATIELAEQPGLRFSSDIVGCAKEDVRIGMPVELEWVEVDGLPCPLFRPAGRDGAEGR